MIARSRRMALLAACMLACLAQPAAAAGPPYAGRPVVEVLEELKDGGLEFIYSSDLVPPGLTVESEPRATDRILVAREILAAHSLMLRAVRPGLFAVVPARKVAHRGLITGHIVNAGSGKSVTGARLQLDPIGAVDWSDERGRFSIGPVPIGTYSLRVEAAGYESSDVAPFAVTTDGANLELGLQAAATELSELVVSTSRYALDEGGSFGAIQFDGETIAAQPTLGDDTVRALARLPGIAQSGISAQSSVRGGETGEVLTLLDGFPLRQVFHIPGYQSAFGVVDAGLISEAEVYTGGFPVRYGNRMAGVFDLTTISAGREPDTAIGLSTLNATVRTSSRSDEGTGEWLASARIGTLRPLLHAFAADAGEPAYGDAYARVAAGEPSRARWSVNALWSRDDLAIAPENSGEDGQIDSRAGYLWVRADHDWSDDLRGSLWLGYSRIESFRDGTIDKPGIGTGSLHDRRKSNFLEARSRFEWRAADAHWLEGGIEWVREDAEYRYDAMAQYTPEAAALFDRDPALARQIALAPERERVAAFAAHRFELSHDFVSEIGLRTTRTLTTGGSTGEWLYDPRVNLLWRLARKTNLRLHWGRFHQTDEVHELKVEDGLTAFPAAQRSDHYILGLDHRFKNGLALRLEGFRKRETHPRPRFENQLDQLSVIPELAVDRVLVAPTAADARGAELSLLFEGFRYTRWIALAWSRAVDEFGGDRTVRSWDQSWALTAGLDWTKGHWRFGAIAAAHRGWPGTRIEDGVLGERNGMRFPTYAVLDLRAEYRRPLVVGSLSVAFEVTNALARENVCCSELRAVDNGTGNFTITARPRSWLPLVPAVAVLWQF